MKSKSCDILIIGGGTPGLALAILLGRLGVQVTVADKYPPPPLKKAVADGRTAALMTGSVNILKATGAWEYAAPFGEELRTLRIIDDSRAEAEPVQVDFRAPEIGLEAFGINMPNLPLRAALGEVAAGIASVTILPAALSSYESDDFGVSAQFDDGTQIRAKLVVGADGRGSVTREIAGIGAKERHYGQHAITCLIDHSGPHEHISTEFHRPSGPFTMVPLPGRRSSIVWVDFDEQAQGFMALDPDSFTQALQERSRDMLGTITLASKPQCCPLISLQAAALTGKRVALAAEAAHVLHPMGAQGLNLSLRDAAALAEIIADAMRAGIDPGSAGVLALYERRRKPDVLSRIIGTDGLNRMVSNEYGLLRGLRRLGLKTLDNVTPLREMAMQHGLAPQSDDGRLARGEKL